MNHKPKYYVVWKGRKAGIFSSWEECTAQVQGYAGAQYKSFASRRAAEQAYRGEYSAQVGKPAGGGDWLFSPNPPNAASWCVDAACSGASGRLEYRGVDLRTGREIFRRGPYEHGTNNVGEFLAIVQALMLLEKKKNESPRARTRSTTPIYSDSSTAIGWVKKKRCNTELAAGESNAPLFELINRAEDWLSGRAIANPILKWDTKAWGEIPADFNRK
jgi:ribonuclease HI